MPRHGVPVKVRLWDEPNALIIRSAFAEGRLRHVDVELKGVPVQAVASCSVSGNREEPVAGRLIGNAYSAPRSSPTSPGATCLRNTDGFSRTSAQLSTTLSIDRWARVSMSC